MADITATDVISAPRFNADTYGLGERIQIRVTWDAAVVVTGTPRCPFNLGQSPVGGPEYMDYVSGSGTTQLVFEWYVAATDEDTNGLFLYGNNTEGLIVLNGGTIDNAATFDADGYGALTWDEVGEIVDVGEFGIENAITEYNILDDGDTRKVYGNQNNAVLSCRALMRAGNTGQDALIAGARNQTLVHFRVVLADGTIFYFAGLMERVKRSGIEAGGFLMVDFTVAIDHRELIETY